MSDLKRKSDDVATHKQPKRKKTKPRVLEGEDFDDERGLNLAISRMDAKGLSDYVGSRTKQLEPKLSAVELDDLRISGSFGTEGAVMCY